MAKNLSPAGTQGTSQQEVIVGNQKENSLISNGNSFIFNLQNIHKFEVYMDVLNHPGTTVGCTCDRLGFYDGTPKNYRHRKLIADCFEIYVFAKIFRKDYHRFWCTGKKPLRLDPRKERVFDGHGMPRIPLKPTWTMPGYAHLEPAGSDGE